MKPGDIILCSGNGFLSRRIIRYSEIILGMTGMAAELSHVAMIGPGESQVFEATTINMWCGKKGVQYNSFAEWIENYGGRVWIRRCNHRITPTTIIKIQAKMLSLLGTPYEHGIPGALELLLAGISIPWLSQRVAQSLRTRNCVHCSEVDALVLQYAGVLPPELRPNKLPPCFWWDRIEYLDFYYGSPERIK